MDLREDCPALQDSRTVLNSSELESNVGTDPKTVLYTLRRTTCDEGLRHEGSIHMAQGRIFGSLETRGAYIVNSMDVVRGDLSTSHPKAGQILRRTLAQQALQRWDQSPPPPSIPGAKEERAFVKSYEDMVRSLQHVPEEEVENYFAYIEHRLRSATSNDGGKTLGPLLSELFPSQERYPKMENLALRDAQALDPERYGKLRTKFSIKVDNSQNEAWKNQVPRVNDMNANKSGGQLPSKRKRPLEGVEDAQTLNTEINDKLTGSSTIYGNTIKDKIFESAETATKENEVEKSVVATTDNIGPFRFLSGMNIFGRKSNYSWIPRGYGCGKDKFGKANRNTQISDTPSTGPTTSIPDFTTPFTLFGGPMKRRKLSDDVKDEALDESSKTLGT
ncbi:74986a37-1dfb-473a-af30-479334f59ff8 [Sclerotinia trifoliorum]|uniref:74986a37-1dfb-473a-af30-479334f59ff8 n=1 Tax=Sclerotinia trifoliorum TaxID=28548 RepID=A0A8H2VP11_9HELO|nr:74986a37-1dfb-473a-af30-479334f59ff8 [Sclerotinia trifoliorum]